VGVVRKQCFVADFQNDHVILIGEKRKFSISRGSGILELDGTRCEFKTDRDGTFAA
jgi:hypothetical protein